MALKSNQNRTIVLPFTEKRYASFMANREMAHEIIRHQFGKTPELFPLEMRTGYVLNGNTRISKKMGIKMRKIKVSGISYRIRPSFVLPYCRGNTNEVSKPLFLLRFGVPFWALAFVFGRNGMWWYRLYLSLGQFSIVGTTVHKAEKLPADILADEHHIRIRGKKAYVATTTALGCFLGMAVCPKADEASLEKGYVVFKEEASDLDPDYKPGTVNTDGWQATQNAWQSLYPTIKVIECFLHAYLKVRDRATKKLKQYFDTAGDKIWDCYRALSKRSLAQQIRRLGEWTAKIPDCPMKENILKLCKKKAKWMIHLDFPLAHRTSNLLDRLMRAMKKHAFNSQMFHGTVSTASMNFRAFALLHNFSPSSPAAWDESQKLISPAARLNGFVYHEDWLQNLLIAASLGGFRHHRNPL